MPLFDVRSPLLWPITFPLHWAYRATIRFRNFSFDVGWRTQVETKAPVISIGNLCVGGTGKTPFSIWLAMELQKEGLQPALIASGYRRAKKGMVLLYGGNVVPVEESGDEPAIIARHCPDIPVMVQDRKRSAAIDVEKQFSPDCILLDDGFQHRSLKRRFDLLLINSELKANEMQVMPFGRMRESWRNQKRADAIIMSKWQAGQSNPFLHKIHSDALLLHAGQKFKLQSIQNGELKNCTQPVGIGFAFSALAKNSGFRTAAQNSGLTLAGWKSFRDHHNYKQSDLKSIYEKGKSLNAEYFICTEKDLVKILTLSLPFEKLYVLTLEVHMEPAERELLISKILEKIS